tara:strand:+ start:13001 stop:13165 length:165 start_codon:yes stop_codon:yes gene_type:complete
MSIFAYGTLPVTDVKSGDTKITRIYHGETVLYENFGSEPPQENKKEDNEEQTDN